MKSIPLRDRAHAARRIRARRAPVGAALLLGMLVLAGPARAQIVDPTLWVTDGAVFASVPDGAGG